MTNEELLAQNKAQAIEIAELKRELSAIKKLLFGQKSERFVSNEPPADQLSIFTENDEEIASVDPATQTITYERKKSKPHPGRNTIPDHIPVEIRVIEPEQDTAGMKCIGKDITRALDYRPAKLICIQYERPKYVATTGESSKIIEASLPSRPIEKGIAEAGLLSHFFVSKFIDHLPFYRQIEMFKRDHRVNFCSSTVNGWFIKCTELLAPLYHAMKAELLITDYLQVDESPIKVMDKEKLGKIHQGYMWVYHNVDRALCIFEYSKGRSKSSPKTFLKNFGGYLQCDGYQVYDAIGKNSQNITLIGCLAHTRRYFHEALKTDKEKAQKALTIIQRIYQIQRAIKEKKLDGPRHELIKPLLKELKDWADKTINTVTPKSAIGKAIAYTINQWPKLENIIIEDRIQLDNNLIENKIRPLALGRKNYLFAGNHGSAQRIAMMYSFFATCKVHDINPHEWMTDVLQRLPDHNIQDLHQLLPHKWSKANSQSSM